MDAKELGSIIKKYRLEMGLTQKELAKMIPVTRQAVSNWENGKAIPDYSALIILSRIFDIIWMI